MVGIPRRLFLLPLPRTTRIKSDETNKDGNPFWNPNPMVYSYLSALPTWIFQHCDEVLDCFCGALAWLDEQMKIVLHVKSTARCS